MSKVFFMDVETTGTHRYKNDILQLAYIIEINREVVKEGVFSMQPFDYSTIDPKALEVNRLSLATIKTWPRPQDVYPEIVKLLDDFVDRFNRNDKFYVAGYNVRFDTDFLRNFFKKNGDMYYGSYFSWKLLDPLAILHLMDYTSEINLENYKLETVCSHFGIPLRAHDAKSDIHATRELLRHLLEL